MPIKKTVTDPNVLKELDDAIVQEELALPVYASHIKAAMFWSGLPAEKQEQIRAGLEILLNDSIGHVHLLKRVKRIYRLTQ